MELILLRHGKAEDDHPEGDFHRALTEKGREQARRAARLLRRAKELPQIVITSPLVRAKQTADEFCETAGMPGAITQSWLACGMAPEDALAELTAFPDFRSIMLVGHEPDFSLLVQHILGVTLGEVEVRKGALVCLEISPPSPRGMLRYIIPSRLTETPDE